MNTFQKSALGALAVVLLSGGAFGAYFLSSEEKELTKNNPIAFLMGEQKSDLSLKADFFGNTLGEYDGSIDAQWQQCIDNDSAISQNNGKVYTRYNEPTLSSLYQQTVTVGGVQYGPGSIEFADNVVIPAWGGKVTYTNGERDVQPDGGGFVYAVKKYLDQQTLLINGDCTSVYSNGAACDCNDDICIQNASDAGATYDYAKSGYDFTVTPGTEKLWSCYFQTEEVIFNKMFGEFISYDNVDTTTDSDGDLVPDYQESIDGTDANDPKKYKDDDGDLVPNHVEMIDGTNVNDINDFKDTDTGGTPDYVETLLYPVYNLSTTNPATAENDIRDTDNDGISDYDELKGKTDPNDASDPVDTTTDSDGDLVPDYQESIDGTDANDPKKYKDDDGDLVPNHVEMMDGTDTNDGVANDDGNSYKDTDNGGTPDYVEVTLYSFYGLQATNPAYTEDDIRDTDLDGVPNYIEIQDATNPNDPQDYKDDDGDLVPNHVEMMDGTDVNDGNSYIDTDAGGTPDYVETILLVNVLAEGTDPITNALRGTDPNNARDDNRDYDGDGITDYDELRSGTNPGDRSDPSLIAGVKLFEHVGFKGIAESIALQDADLGDNTIGDNIVSSFQVPHGCSVEVFEDINFGGASHIFQKTVFDIRDTVVANDTVSSVKVSCGVQLFQHGFSNGFIDGVVENFTSDDADLRDNSVGNDTVTSLEIAPGCSVEVFEHINFNENNAGVSQTFTAPAVDVRGTSIENDTISSVKVSCESF